MTDTRIVELLEQVVAEIRALREATHARPGPLLDRAELAALLRVHPRQVRRLELLGDVPKAIFIGGAKRWRRSELEHALERKRA